MVCPVSVARCRAAFQRSSGTRTERIGVPFDIGSAGHREDGAPGAGAERAVGEHDAEDVGAALGDLRDLAALGDVADLQVLNSLRHRCNYTMDPTGCQYTPLNFLEVAA